MTTTRAWRLHGAGEAAARMRGLDLTIVTSGD